MRHVYSRSDMPIYKVKLPPPTHGDGPEAECIASGPPGQTVHRRASRDWLASYVGVEPIEVDFLDDAGRQRRRDEQSALVYATQRTIAERLRVRRPCTRRR
jgi:hypothetical protein